MRRSTDIVVKGFLTDRFSVEMIQDIDGRYRIEYSCGGNEADTSEWITDYNTASFFFDLKIKDLEGN